MVCRMSVDDLGSAPPGTPSGTVFADASLPDADETANSTGRGTGLRLYLIALVLLVLLPALLLGAVTTWELGGAYRRAEEAGLASTTEALATAVDREVEVAVTALSTLATSPALASDDIADFYPQAAAVGRAFGGWVALLDADSRQVLNTLRPLRADLPRGGGNPFVEKAITTGRPVMSDLFLGATAGKPVISVFHPLPAGRSGAARVLLLASGPERLAALLAHQRFSDPGGFAVLTDGNGRVVARSSEQERFANQPSPHWYVEAIRNQDRGLVRGGPSLAGYRGVLAFTRLQHAPSWVVAVVTPYDPHRWQWWGPALRYALGAALLSGIAAFLAMLVAKRILVPLQALALDADALTSGVAPASSVPERITEMEAVRRALWRSVAATHAQGAAEGRAKAAEDASAALREAARRRDLLVRELNHRVKNTLAAVQSLASQTAAGTRGNPDRFVPDFMGRLRTLAQAHDLLTASDWEGAEMGPLVEAVLAPWHCEGRISTSGPHDVRVVAHQAQALALALHELATNAVKYGALSVEGGRVEVAWWTDGERGDPRLELRWRETGGPRVDPAARSGFGSRLLERGLPRQLRGGASLSFPPTGVEYQLWMPRAGD
jgi:two-component sensor histidine kinase